MADLFTNPDTWTGGSIELLLWFDRSALASPVDVLGNVWNWSSVKGPVLSNSEDYSTQQRVDVANLSAVDVPSLYGIAALPNKTTTVCATHAFLESEEPGFYVCFGLPLGSLSRSYPVGAYPFDASPSDPWALEVHAWLADLAFRVHDQFPFAGGIIGFLTTMEFDEVRRGDIPEDRYHGYLSVSNGGLHYLEPNVAGPLMTAGSR